MKKIIYVLFLNLFLPVVIFAQQQWSGPVLIGTIQNIDNTALQVNGNMILSGSSGVRGSYLYTGTGNVESNRYLWLLNSPSYQSASGLKVGGVLISDDYTFANPAKNDLIVKGYVGIGTASPLTKFSIAGGFSKTSGFSVNSGDVHTTIFNSSATNAGIIQVYSNGSSTSIGSSPYHLLIQPEGGSVGIGVVNSHNFNSDYALYVKRGIRTEKIKVDVAQGVWADYVFEHSYKLRPLFEVEQYIQENKHLPDVPSAQQVEKEGLNLEEMDAILLKKIEELTLYMIEQDKKIRIMEQKLSKKCGN
jgi:hypothetical protein